jgi:hypothetical protein
MSALVAVSWRGVRNFGRWHLARPAASRTLCGARIPYDGPISRMGAHRLNPWTNCSRCAAVHHHEMMKKLEVTR